MNDDDVDFVLGLLKQRSGLDIGRDKKYLIESRLDPLARKAGHNGPASLVRSLRNSQDEALLQRLVEAMTTNESLFFRDSKPFEYFRQVIVPEIRRKRSIRILCAACSSGQEPYSLAMILKEEMAKSQGPTAEIIGIDLSTEILDRARSGIFNSFEIQRGLPPSMLARYFTRVGQDWQIDASIRSMVQFRKFNLLDDLRQLGRFDIVFCRNVLIYFDVSTKTRVLEGVSRILADDGTLFLGSAESVYGITEKFKIVHGHNSVYRFSHTMDSAPLSALGGTLRPFAPAY